MIAKKYRYIDISFFEIITFLTNLQIVGRNLIRELYYFFFIPQNYMLQLFMYNIHSCITCIPNFGHQRFGKKKFSCVIRIDIFEFVVAKFNLNLPFVEFFYQFVLTKNKKLYSLRYVLKHNIYTKFRAITWTCSHKKATLEKQTYN